MVNMDNIYRNPELSKDYISNVMIKNEEIAFYKYVDIYNKSIGDNKEYKLRKLSPKYYRQVVSGQFRNFTGTFIDISQGTKFSNLANYITKSMYNNKPVQFDCIYNAMYSLYNEDIFALEDYRVDYTMSETNNELKSVKFNFSNIIHTCHLFNLVFENYSIEEYSNYIYHSLGYIDENKVFWCIHVHNWYVFIMFILL